MEITDIIIPFLVVVAVVLKAINLTKTGKNEGKEVAGEVFPSVEPLEPVAGPSAPAKKPRKGVEQQKPAHRSASPSPAVQGQPTGTNEPAPAGNAKKGRFAIKDKSDAKKAIIYSEIFNRKYN